MQNISIETQLALAEQQLNVAVSCLNEGHGQALAIGPSFARGAETNSPASLAELLSHMAV